MSKQPETTNCEEPRVPRLVIDVDENGNFALYSDQEIEAWRREFQKDGEELTEEWVHIAPRGWLDYEAK